MWEKDIGVKDERVQLKCAAQVSNKLCYIPASSLKILKPVPTGFASSGPDNLQDLLERLAEMKNRSDVAAAELEDVKSKLEQTSQAKAQLEKTSTAAAAELEHVRSIKDEVSREAPQWWMVVLGACALLICFRISWFAKGLATGLS